METKSEKQNKTNQAALSELIGQKNYLEDRETGSTMFLKPGAGHDSKPGTSLSRSILFRIDKSFRVYQYLVLFLISFPVFINAQCDNQNKGGQIKIITWNIYMLPRVFIHTGQLESGQNRLPIL